MSGIAVIRSLVAGNAPILSALGSGPPAAASRVIAGTLNIGTVMPAIGIVQISSIPNNFINTNSANKMHIDRVQVSVKCKWPQTAISYTGYPGVKALLLLVLAACPNQRGTVNGISVDSIVPDIEQIAEADTIDLIQEGSRDFFVRWIGA